MDTQKYADKLIQERNDLEEDIREYSKVPDFGDEPSSDSMEEETDESTEFGNNLAMAQELRERLEDVEEALRKIEKGEYGICEKCQGEIGENIMEINPASRLCQECKKELNH